MGKYFIYVLGFLGILVVVFFCLVVFNVFPNLNKNLSILIYKQDATIASTEPAYTTYYLSGFKLMITLPKAWSVVDDYVGDGSRGVDVFNGYKFLKDGVEQFSFAVGDGAKLTLIAQSPDTWYFEEFTIGEKLEKITMLKENEVFKELYAGINDNKFVIISNQAFNTGMMDIFDTIIYTNNI